MPQGSYPTAFPKASSQAEAGLWEVTVCPHVLPFSLPIPVPHPAPPSFPPPSSSTSTVFFGSLRKVEAYAETLCTQGILCVIFLKEFSM